MRSPNPLRRGFTLVELIVVIAIMLFVVSLAIMFLPSATSEAREANAAVAVHSWLNLARQRALRDQAPRGLRLWIDDPSTMQVTRAEFLEQPDDYTGEQLQAPPPSSTDMTKVQINGDSIFNGQPGNAAAWLVQPKDYLEICRSGLMHQITNISVFTDNSTIPATTKAWLTLANPLPFAVTTTNYRILRSWRPIGDEALTLPDNIVIDLKTNQTYKNGSVYYNPLPNGVGPAPLDIVFTPSGTVITPGVTTDTINLWVRAIDPMNPNDFYAGNPTIVAVFVRTGLVGAFAPDAAGHNNASQNPYTLVH